MGVTGIWIALFRSVAKSLLLTICPGLPSGVVEGEDAEGEDD